MKLSAINTDAADAWERGEFIEDTLGKWITDQKAKRPHCFVGEGQADLESAAFAEMNMTARTKLIKTLGPADAETLRGSQLLHTHISQKSSELVAVKVLGLVIERRDEVNRGWALIIKSAEEELLNIRVDDSAPLRRIQVFFREDFVRPPVMPILARIFDGTVRKVSGF
jgi:hypothetical protein